MSDKSHIGQWVAPYTDERGDVAVLYVSVISRRYGGECYTLSDGTAWAVETGEPLDRKWKGHRLRAVSEDVIMDRLPGVLAKVRKHDDTGALIQIYATALEALREKPHA